MVWNKQPSLAYSGIMHRWDKLKKVNTYRMSIYKRFLTASLQQMLRSLKKAWLFDD